MFVGPNLNNRFGREPRRPLERPLSRTIVSKADILLTANPLRLNHRVNLARDSTAPFQLSPKEDDRPAAYFC